MNDLSNTPAVAPGPGHNNPPKTIPEQLAEAHARLADEIAVLATRANDAPVLIGNDEVLGMIADIGRDAGDLWKQADKTREAEKAPYLKAGRDVDGFFKAHLERLARIVAAMRQRADAYNNAKLEAHRAAQRQAEAAARQEADERRQQAEEAAKAGRVDDAMADIAEAAKAEAKADQVAEAAADVKPADIVRQQTDGGTNITARTEWTHEITDLDKIPMDRLRPFFKRDAVDAAIKLFVKQGNHELAGVRIFEKSTTQFRR